MLSSLACDIERFRWCSSFKKYSDISFLICFCMQFEMFEFKDNLEAVVSFFLFESGATNLCCDRVWVAIDFLFEYFGLLSLLLFFVFIWVPWFTFRIRPGVDVAFNSFSLRTRIYFSFIMTSFNSLVSLSCLSSSSIYLSIFDSILACSRLTCRKRSFICFSSLTIALS